MARRTLILVAIGSVVAACSGAATPPPTPTPEPTTAALEMCEIAAADGSTVLDAGAYHVSSTTPGLTLTVPAGYTATCADGTVALFGPDQTALIVVAPLAVVRHGESNTSVNGSLETARDAVLAAAVETTDPVAVTLDGAEGVELVATVDAQGLGLRSSGDRGWGFNNEESPTGGISLFAVADGVVGVVRHGADPLAAADDVLGSISFDD